MSSDGLSAPRTRRIVPDEIGESFEREVFAVQRDQHSVGCNERVECQQPERRWAIDEDVVELGPERIQHALQPVLAVRQRNQLDLRTSQTAICRQERQVRDLSGQDIRQRWRGLRHEGLVHGSRFRALGL